VSVVFLSAAALRAETGGFAVPAAGARLVPESRVEAVWSRGVASESADESELVLSLDGGRTFPFRVSAEIEPGQTRVEWRVPDLPSAHARLALRVGRDDDSESETLEVLSEEFAILADPAAPPERLFRFGGEWRSREALALPASRSAPLATLDPAGGLAAPSDTDESADAPRPQPLAVPTRAGLEIASHAAGPPEPRPGKPRCVGPICAPLRL